MVFVGGNVAYLATETSDCDKRSSDNNYINRFKGFNIFPSAHWVFVFSLFDCWARLGDGFYGALPASSVPIIFGAGCLEFYHDV